MSAALLAEVVRSGYVEGRLTGSLVVLDARGEVVLGLGDLDRPVFPRSSNKPLQASGLLAAGWQPASDEQLALATSSHSGEPGHVAVVREVLDELDPETSLGCPPARPLDDSAWEDIVRAGGGPTRLTMTCSGKHAAMLRTCVVNGWPTEGYLDVTHPVQRACLAAVERLSGEIVRHVAVDGCGAPQHALTLPGLARAFAAVDEPVAQAMRNRPWHVAGTGRPTTRLMEGLPGLICKDGAEEVFAAAVPGVGSVALRVEDAGARARTPVLVAGLRALGLDAPVLDELATVPVLGGGRPVGEVRVAGALV